GGSGREVHRDARGRIKIGDASQRSALAVDSSSYGVVAAHTLEFVETNRGAGSAGRAIETSAIERVGEIRSDDAFDAGKGVGADTGTGNGSGCEVEGDASGRIGIDRPVKAQSAIENVVAGKPLEPVVAGEALDGVVADRSGERVRAG